MATTSSDVTGLNELIQMVEKLGRVPNKYMNAAVKKGAKLQQNSMKQFAPEDEGYLRKGIVIKAEKPRRKNKKTVQVTFDKKYTPIYRGEQETVLPNTRRKKRGKSSANGGYYPSSQEFGYKLVNGGYHPGLHFIKITANRNSNRIKQVIVEDLSAVVDKLLKGG